MTSRIAAVSGGTAWSRNAKRARVADVPQNRVAANKRVRAHARDQEEAAADEPERSLNGISRTTSVSRAPG